MDINGKEKFQEYIVQRNLMTVQDHTPENTEKWYLESWSLNPAGDGFSLFICQLSFRDKRVVRIQGESRPDSSYEEAVKAQGKGMECVHSCCISLMLQTTPHLFTSPPTPQACPGKWHIRLRVRNRLSWSLAGERELALLGHKRNSVTPGGDEKWRGPGWTQLESLSEM